MLDFLSVALTLFSQLSKHYDIKLLNLVSVQVLCSTQNYTNCRYLHLREIPVCSHDEQVMA